MSDIYFNIYVQNESLNFRIKDGITLDELASVISSFFEREENWHKMKECWLENGKSKDFQRLMEEAILGAYDTFCVEPI